MISGSMENLPSNPPIALRACTPENPPGSTPFSAKSLMPPPKTDCHRSEKPLVTCGPTATAPPPGDTTMPRALTV